MESTNTPQPSPLSNPGQPLLLRNRPGVTPIGEVVGSMYRVESLLAKGGIGSVFAATQLRTGGRVAIKFLSHGPSTDAEIRRRFHDEARILTTLKHPHIVTILDFCDDPVFGPFLVMELLSGVDLQALLHTRSRLPFALARQLALQIGGALQAAHDGGIIHRDVKPQNLFVVDAQFAESEQLFVKVLDFGVSRIVSRTDQRTEPMMVLGTPHYMAPEVAQGQAFGADARSDLFSLAVVLYQALSGRRPFDAEEPLAILWQVVHMEPPPIESLCPDIPNYAAAAITRAMAKRPEDRFGSVADFVRALFGAYSGGFAQPRPVDQAPATLLPTLQPHHALLRADSARPDSANPSSLGGSSAESFPFSSTSASSARSRLRYALGGLFSLGVLVSVIGVGRTLWKPIADRPNAPLRSQEPTTEQLRLGKWQTIAHASRPKEETRPTVESKPRPVPSPACVIPSSDCLLDSAPAIPVGQKRIVTTLLRKYRIGACAKQQLLIFRALDRSVQLRGDIPPELKRRMADVNQFWAELEGTLGYGSGLKQLSIAGPGRGNCTAESE